MGKSVYVLLTLAAVRKRPHTREAAHVRVLLHFSGEPFSLVSGSALCGHSGTSADSDSALPNIWLSRPL